jgi:hypothetical protein
MRRVILLSEADLAVQYYLFNSMILGGKVWNTKRVLIYIRILSEIFLVLRKIQGDKIIIIRTDPWPLFWSDFNQT